MVNLHIAEGGLCFFVKRAPLPGKYFAQFSAAGIALTTLLLSIHCHWHWPLPLTSYTIAVIVSKYCLWHLKDPIANDIGRFID